MQDGDVLSVKMPSKYDLMFGQWTGEDKRDHLDPIRGRNWACKFKFAMKKGRGTSKLIRSHKSFKPRRVRKIGSRSEGEVFIFRREGQSFSIHHRKNTNEEVIISSGLIPSGCSGDLDLDLHRVNNFGTYPLEICSI